jgi:outer membrane protein OmpA-like peptidoglycan-associated protein
VYHKTFLGIFLSLASVISFAQDDNKEVANQIVEIANEAYYNLRVIVVANEQYVQAAELDNENIEANYMAGKTFLETNFKSQATKYLLRVYDLDPDYKFNILYMIGQGYQYGMDFDAAINYYNRYLNHMGRNSDYRGKDFIRREEVERRIYECNNGREYKSVPKTYTVENLGPSINSEWDDYAPVLTEDESFMVFTTRRQDGNTNEDVFDDMLYYEDIFYSHKEGDSWNYAQNLGPPLNNRFHDSNLAINAEGTELYLFKSQNGGDIFVSNKLGDGTWSEPEPLNDNINSTFSENSVSISPDGTVLFFSSDRPISADKTDLDIYYATKDRRGEWTKAKNIGPVINTPYDEDGPFIDYDEKTLYFSSKGHKGMGGYDIYKSVYDSATESWSNPINLGYPMNSPDNDVYFVSTRDGKRGYYASSREDGLGFTDIYHIRLADLDDPDFASGKDVESETDPGLLVTPETLEIEEPEEEPVVPEEEPVEEVTLYPVVVLLKSVDAENNEVIDIDLTVSRSSDNRPVNYRKLDRGLYRIEFNENSQSDYRFTAQRSGYMFKNLTVSIPSAGKEPRELKRFIALNKIQEGFSAILRNIYFDFNKATLKTISYTELRNVKKIMEENPHYNIEIAGHTDKIGTKDFNLGLSQKRAQAVINYLKKQGINEGRMTAKGYGESKPLASNDDEKEGRELNRRVEFKVLGMEK